jgi:hypothetical protein
VCQSPFGGGTDFNAFGAAGGFTGLGGYGSCNSDTLIYINGVCGAALHCAKWCSCVHLIHMRVFTPSRTGICAPTYGFAYNPYLFAAATAVTQSTYAQTIVKPVTVLRPGSASIVGRILAVLVPGRLALPDIAAAAPTEQARAESGNQSSSGGGTPLAPPPQQNASAPPLDTALDAFFASQRCPVALSAGSALALALDALAPRCIAASSAAGVCAACVAEAEAALLRAAWRALPSLPPGALAEAAAQAACGRAAVDALVSRGVPAQQLRAAGGQCGDFASRPQCAIADLPALAQPLLLGCRGALAAAVSRTASRAASVLDAPSATGFDAAAFNATTSDYCGSCYWPALALILNAAPLSDSFWCRAARIAWSDENANDMFFDALLGEASFAACMLNLQALSRRELAADVLVDPRAKVHQARCWEPSFQPRGATGLLSDATRLRVARLPCQATAPAPQAQA